MVTKRFLIFLTIAFLLFLLFGIPENKKEEQQKAVVHTLLGEKEGCVTCHGKPTGFSPSHPVEVFGCTPCHSGNATALDVATAHNGMIVVPGNLSDVYQTCGAVNCHHDIADRVGHSLMTSMSGVISVDKFVFGELEKPEGQFHIQNLGFSAADTHLRHLCASCHLGNPKTHPGAITELSRGGGCNACHLNYSAEALAALDETENKVHAFHPALTVEVKDEHCFGCHSRSSRISLNYAGWHETKLLPNQIQGQPTQYRVLEDGRVVEYIDEDVHHQAGLSCIDCHHVLEVMGDGNIYEHKEEALLVHCADCHRPAAETTTIGYDDLDTESKKLLSLRNIPVAHKQFFLTENEIALINAWMDTTGQAVLQGKNNGQQYQLKAPAEACTRSGGHSRLSCESCHTAWAPQCVGCHNAYNPEATVVDLLDNKTVQGRWEEYVGTFFHDAPALGVIQPSPEAAPQLEEIRTFISGMMLTIDQASFEDEKSATFHRLYAPTAAHTISREGRSCRSCHNNPLALGYGRGKLTFDKPTASWSFEAEYADTPQDGLPQDAWIGFLEEPEAARTTRTYARPFRIAEQKRILTVGACLSCHQEQDPMLEMAIEDFTSMVAKKKEECVLPVW